MNIEKIKEILIQSKIYVKDKSKNFICICPYCGDHPDPKKKGHLWISKNPELPIGHCFFCNNAWPTNKIISDISGNKNLANEVCPENQNQKKNIIKHSKLRFKELKFPIIEPNNSFLSKRIYLKKRTCNLTDAEKIPHLILDFSSFFQINNLDLVGDKKQLSDKEMGILQSKFVGFVGKHNSIMYCRNCDDNDYYKFKKIVLQEDSFDLLEYYHINGSNPTCNKIILSEGNFNILSESLTDSLGLKNDVRVYASGGSFSYSSLLKSVCFDYNIYQADVIILSDNDKKVSDYKRFLSDNSHIINSVKIYHNSRGKDFGTFPVCPIQIY